MENYKTSLHFILTLFCQSDCGVYLQRRRKRWGRLKQGLNRVGGLFKRLDNLISSNSLNSGASRRSRLSCCTMSTNNCLQPTALLPPSIHPSSVFPSVEFHITYQAVAGLFGLWVRQHFQWRNIETGLTAMRPCPALNVFHYPPVITGGDTCLEMMQPKINVYKACQRCKVLNTVMFIPHHCWKHHFGMPTGAEGGGEPPSVFEGCEGFASGLSTLNLCDSADGYLPEVEAVAFWQQANWLSGRGY